MTDELAERIAGALERIAFNLSAEGAIAEELDRIRRRLEEITPTTDGTHRYLRTLDVGRE
jgi:hypothetical protein